ncbi:MAG: TRAP transporter small permease [Candidatus Aminicenantes bacterium]|nr:TRAP transporter small permease [Candidatus Aminicenantes bacterium]
MRGKTLIKHLDKILITFFLCCVIGGILLQILSRLFNQSFSWTQEFSCFSYVWSIFIGVPLVYRNDAHIKISFFYDHFPPKVRNILWYVNEIIILLCVIVLFAPALKYALAGLRMRSPSMEIPMFFVDISIPLCFILLARHIIAKIVLKIKEGTL